MAFRRCLQGAGRRVAICNARTPAGIMDGYHAFRNGSGDCVAGTLPVNSEWTQRTGQADTRIGSPEVHHDNRPREVAGNTDPRERRRSVEPSNRSGGARGEGNCNTFHCSPQYSSGRRACFAIIGATRGRPAQCIVRTIAPGCGSGCGCPRLHRSGSRIGTPASRGCRHGACLTPPIHILGILPETRI